MCRFALPLLLLAASALPAFAADSSDVDAPVKLSPLQIGQIFCIARAGNDMAPIEAIVTPTLAKAIAKADTLNAAWAKKHPGEEPPLGDGLPWQATTDYTANCTADHASSTATTAQVEVSYAFTGDAAANYTDTLMLSAMPDATMGDKVWRIDDVVFADKSHMRQAMIDAFKP